MEDKSAAKSKTIIFNIVSGIAAIALMAGIDVGLDVRAQASIAQAILGIVTGVNILLRFVTNSPLAKFWQR